MWNPNWDWNEYWRLYIDYSIYKKKKEILERVPNECFPIDFTRPFSIVIEAFSRR